MRCCTECFHYKACLHFFESSMGCGVPSDYPGGNANRCEDYVSAADVAPRAEVIEEYRKKVYAKMGKYTVMGREYIQRIMREVEKEMKGGE